MSRTEKKRVVIVGAGLCGSVLAALLRNRFHVTVVEQGRTTRPLFDDIACPAGDVTTSINRAEGLGGTTNYWHNALIELTAADLRKAGIASGSLEPYYSTAWRFFLDEAELARCEQLRLRNQEAIEHGRATVAHMVLPRQRANVWELASQRYPGDDIDVLIGQAISIGPGADGSSRLIDVRTGRGVVHLPADYVIAAAGGLATPALLARSTDPAPVLCDGYHDHPMAYVAKVRLKPGSQLPDLSCTTTASAEVRAGFVYESAGLKTVIYLRPARNLDTRSITGPARFVLSDLRNDPFSPTKIFRLLTNLEAVREAVLFKTQAGFRGDCYSLLLFGEQDGLATRGLRVADGSKPALNWHVTDGERAAYASAVEAFLDEFSGDIVDSRVIPVADWDFRTGAHHSGAARRFLGNPGDLSLEHFAVTSLPGTFVCDGSLLRAAGIANSGLTLVALSHRLAELLPS